MSKSKEQIPALVASNLDGLGRLCSLLESRNQSSQSLAQSYLARFKLWAGSLGAHRTSGTRSLEYRLRDASSIRKHLTSLLQELKAIVLGEALPFLQSGHDTEGRQQLPDDSVDDELAALFDADSEDDFDTSIDESSKEVTDLLFGIGNIIDCLLRLSVTISNPAPHDHFKSRAGVELSRHFEPHDIMHVCDKFPRINHKLAERLGRMLTYRRRYFKYREDHHIRLKQGLEGGLDDEVSLGRGTTVASSLPQDLNDGAQMHLTVVNDNRSEISATSHASSALGESNLRVPPIPKEYIDGPFLCPFCYVFISVDSRNEWKKHVFRDLRPYACLEETCVVNHDFQRRKDWTRHMLQDHWRAWACPFGCVGEYSSSSALRNHLHQNHAVDVSGQDVDVSVNLSSKANVSRGQGPCPLCHDFEIRSSHQYRSHVGHHLEQLALFVLPTQYDDDDDIDNDEFADEISHPSQDSDLEAEETRQQYEPPQGQENEQVDQGVVDVEALESERTSPKSPEREDETILETLAKETEAEMIAEELKAREQEKKQRETDEVAAVERGKAREAEEVENERRPADYDAVDPRLFRELQDPSAQEPRKSEVIEKGLDQSEAERRFKIRMEEMQKAQEEAKEEIELARIAAENAARERIEEERKAEAELQRQHAEMMAQAERHARDRLEKVRKEEAERQRQHAEAMAKAEREAKEKYEAALKTEEERTVQQEEENETAEEAARLKYEAQVRLMLEKERLEAEESKRRLEKAEKGSEEFLKRFEKEAGVKMADFKMAQQADKERREGEENYEYRKQRPKTRDQDREAAETDAEREYVRRLTDQLRASGLPEIQIETIIEKRRINQGSRAPPPPMMPVPRQQTAQTTTTKTTYTRMARRHLSLECLNERGIDYELDANPDYVLIKRWVPPKEQKELWSRTKVIRDERKKRDAPKSSTSPTVKLQSSNPSKLVPSKDEAQVNEGSRR